MIMASLKLPSSFYPRSHIYALESRVLKCVTKTSERLSLVSEPLDRDALEFLRNLGAAYREMIIRD